MLEIGKTIISLDLIRCKFSCDLDVCKGACCVMGDSGAPLEADEVRILDEIYPVIRPFLRTESAQTIEEQGTSVIDIENDTVTPLNSGMECAYVIYEDGIAHCVIEKAFNLGLITFRKPVSCHLYPIRIKKYQRFDAVNYDRWDICSPAVTKGNQEETPVFAFAKSALTRKYGEEWVEMLGIAANDLAATIPEK
jgi:hypothetical protein